MMYRVQQWKLFVAGVLVILINVVFVQGCPPECVCDFSYPVTVSCINSALTRIPAKIPYNTVILNLNRNRITDFNNELKKLVHLQILDLSLNNIRMINFPLNLNVSELYLQSNAIHSITPGAFQNLPNMRVLNLAHNLLTYLKPNTFIGLDNLQTLNLSYNGISAIDSDILMGMERLKCLDLTNSLSVVDKFNLTVLSELEELKLAANNIEWLNWTMFYQLEKLTTLDLSRNLIPYVDSESFPSLPELSVLYLNSNNISYITNGGFKSLPSLRKLSLDENNLSEIVDNTFQSLSELDELSLTHMDELVYLSKNAFSGLGNLRDLQLCQNPKLSFIHIHLFNNLGNLQYLNVSFNNISSIHSQTFPAWLNVSIDLQGNPLICDCRLEWLIQTVQNDTTSNNRILHTDKLECSLASSEGHYHLANQKISELHCDTFNVSTMNNYVSAKIGASVILSCEITGISNPTITWITNRNVNLTLHNTHTLALREIPSAEDVTFPNGSFHIGHEWHDSGTYYSQLKSWPDRIIILQDGSLYIDYLLRSDSGPYQCIVEDPRGNSSSVEITLRLDHQIIPEVKIMSLFVGLGCSASFFMLNLIHVIITYLAVRCINQRRREAIHQLIENLDNYRSTQVGRLKDNYNSQLAKIRDTYHNRVAKLRENYSHQVSRIRTGASHIKEGASHKCDTIRDNYNSQLGKLRDYSSHQVIQLRERYNNQLVKIREYGSLQLGRAREKYKLKQQHVLKILETMNFDNCRNVFDTECVRTESMLFVDDFTVETEETGFTSPADSVSVSEYETASSNNTSTRGSLEDLNQTRNNEGLESSAILSQETLNGENSENETVRQNEMTSETKEDSMFVEIKMMDDSDSEQSNSENSEGLCENEHTSEHTNETLV